MGLKTLQIKSAARVGQPPGKEGRKEEGLLDFDFTLVWLRESFKNGGRALIKEREIDEQARYLPTYRAS